jgi:hypothetical protein
MQMTRQEVVAGHGGGRAQGRDFGAYFPSSAPSFAAALPVRSMVGAVAERMLLDTAERALRRRGPEVHALLLRLSQLPPPGPKPHHRRVARALLDEAALRHGGQVFALRNLDLVLLGPPAEATRSLLARLFGDGSRGVVQVLAPGAALVAYARERAAEDLPLLDPPADPASPPPLDAAEALLEIAPPGDLLRAQVAAELLPGGALRPLFREASLRLPTLTARLPGTDGRPATASFPARDLAARLDARTLAIACADLAEAGPLAGGRSGLALHLNLTLSAVLSEGFARLAEIAVAANGGRVGIELSLVEACADGAAFERAKDRVRAAGFTLALDAVEHHALALTHPGRLGTDLVKVEWADELAAAGPDAEAALREIGPARVVLAGADGEAAMRWGYARGVRRFQGRHVDAMLAATRLGACAFASGCTVRLCGERAAAADKAGRTGCRNLALLDAAVVA